MLDVFAAACTLCSRHAFKRDDGTPLNDTWTNIKDWCKNTLTLATAWVCQLAVPLAA